MKNHKLSLLTFVTSLAIAAVAAWYSIIGLTAIFAAAVIPIIIMGIVLEIGKLVAAAWVYNHWRETSILLRTYLVSAIVVLMLITSMGIYGFLSKSHIDAGINTTEISVKLERLDNRINGEQRVIDRAEVATLTVEFTNGLSGTSEKSIKLEFAGVGLSEHSLSIAPVEPIFEDLTFQMRNVKITANNTFIGKQLNFFHQV